MKIMGNPVQRIFDVLEKRLSLIKPEVRSDMERLHPGENPDKLCREYYVSKLTKSITIILVGSILAGLLAFRAAGEREIEGNELRREGVWGEVQKVTVETIIEGETERFAVEVLPMRMTNEEAEACYMDFCQNLPELIVGENASVEEVATDLVLTENYEGYPFLVEWKSDTPDCVSSAGVVVPGAVDCQVALRALVSYEEMEWEKILTVQVPAETLTAREQRYREINNQLLITQTDSLNREYWSLPGVWEDTELQWQRVVEDNSRLLWIAALIVGVAVYFLGDKDLHQEIEKRREQMKRTYPDIVYKLALYLGAGMTLQGAFHKIAAEYEEGRARGQPICPAYEEMLYTCRELKSGVSESKAYERFGLRTGLQEYIRLSTLMVQNLKKGSSSLLSRLQEEADRALIERIQSGRKLGEEASTKLLVPMVMMLGIVMVMVMLPAFSSMGL